MRTGQIERETNETKVRVELCLDGTGTYQIDTGIPFFNHLLESLAKQGLFDLKVSATGDLRVDDHHAIEDTAIALGQAFKQALGSKKGVQRYGFFELPMDDSLARVAIDLGGRSCCIFKASFSREGIGGMSTEAVKEFFEAFSRACECNLHARVAYGSNDHHKAEALFKALGRALKTACAVEPRAPDALQTTKGLM